MKQRTHRRGEVRSEGAAGISVTKSVRAPWRRTGELVPHKAQQEAIRKMVALAGVAKAAEANRRRVAGVLGSRSAISRPSCAREIDGALPITQYCASSTSNLKRHPNNTQVDCIHPRIGILTGRSYYNRRYTQSPELGPRICQNAPSPIYPETRRQL